MKYEKEIKCGFLIKGIPSIELHEILFIYWACLSSGKLLIRAHLDDHEDLDG